MLESRPILDPSAKKINDWLDKVGPKRSVFGSSGGPPSEVASVPPTQKNATFRTTVIA